MLLKNYFICIVSIIVLLCLEQKCQSQETFEKIYDWAWSPGALIQLDDSSYLMAHSQYLAHFKKNGNLDWKENLDMFYSLNTAIYGGDCFYAGAVDYVTAIYAKYDFNGEIVWTTEVDNRSESGSGNYNMLLTPDNKILFAGKFTNNQKDSVFLIKSDTSGLLNWRINFKLQDEYLRIYDLEIINNREYGLLYHTKLAIVDSSGFLKNEINFSLFDPRITQFDVVDDTTFLLLNENTIFKYKLSGNLDTVFQFDSLACNLMYYDKPFIYVFAQGSYGYHSHYTWFYKLDTAGNLYWTKRFGDENEGLYKLIRTNDSGFLLSGTSRTISTSDPYMYFVKTDSEGNASPCKDSLFATKEKYILCLGEYMDIESYSIGSHSTAYWTYRGDTVHSGNEPFIFIGDSLGDFTHVLRSCDDSLVVPVRVYDVVNPDFTYELTFDGVQYYQVPLNDDWRWEWEMGDGFIMDDSLDPFYQYEINGNYFTRLEIWGPCRSDCTKRVIYHLNIDEKDIVKADIYPNPTEGLLNIRMPESEKFTLEVYNIQGILVRSIKNEFGSQFTFDLHDLPPAVYLLQITSAFRKDNFKFIKVCH